MASLKAIRAGITARLKTIAGLHVYSHFPDISPAVPAAIIGAPEIDFDITFARGADSFSLPILIFVARAADRDANVKLDEFLDGSSETSARSIKAVLEADRTLGQAAAIAKVTHVRGVAAYAIGKVDYLGAELTMEIVA